MIDLRPAAMQAQGLVAERHRERGERAESDSSGGHFEDRAVRIRRGSERSPKTVAELNDLPVKAWNGNTIYIHDVANVRDGFSPQTNVVRRDGMRGSLLTVQKVGPTSTLDIVQRVKDALPAIRGRAAAGAASIEPLADQSLFVRAAVNGVIREAVIAACLTAMMILLFLGSWRSTLIIAISIPLSILTSICLPERAGRDDQHHDAGRARAGGRHPGGRRDGDHRKYRAQLRRGKDLHEAILDGAAQIAVPALVSTLCICIVFLPMFFLTGVARYLFIPLAEAVVFAMLASYRAVAHAGAHARDVPAAGRTASRGKASAWNIRAAISIVV